MNGKDYRKLLGFTNKSLFAKHLGAKDIVEPNWAVIEKKNKRLISTMTAINNAQQHKCDISVAKLVNDTTLTIKNANILPRLNNHGRALENVYFNWLLGYVAEVIFTPLISAELNCSNLTRHGGDDFSSLDTFKRTGDADLIDEQAKILVDVQCGITATTRCDIKQHKVNQAVANKDYKSYVFFADLVEGRYGCIGLESLENETFYPNPQWEGQLTHTVSKDTFKDLCDA